MLWLVFLPPLLVFLVGVLTHRIILSFILGVSLAGLIATHFVPWDAAVLVIRRFWEILELEQIHSTHDLLAKDNLFIMIFLLSIGLIIEMMRSSGGAKALVRLVSKSIHDKKSAETSSLIMSHCLFVDDYLSCLSVGSVLRPLTDKLGIARAKLAFLVDSMAAALAIICPVSSWAAAITGFFYDNGISDNIANNPLILATPNYVYMRSLPYIIYSFTLIASVWFIVRKGISFGVMKKYEQAAQSTAESIEQEDDQGTILDFLIPFVSLLGSAFFLLLYMGGWSLLGGTRSFIMALQYSPTALVLSMAAIISITASLTYFVSIRRFTLKGLYQVFISGMKMMGMPVIVLLFAWTLGSLLRNDLKTGEVLASLIGDSVPVMLLPCIFYLIATVTALSLGTAWGTAAILFPIAVPMIVSMAAVSTPTPEQLPILFPVFGAILSGAVCGTNASLMADATIMSSMSSGCNHIVHVNTQWRYIVPVFISTALGFVLTGVLINNSLWLAILLPLVVSIASSLIIIKMMGSKW
jgi:tetracycline resistance efflux pump